MKDAYGPDYALYRPRLPKLTADLHAARINAAAELCRIDFTAG